ncbi:MULTISPECIES: DUF2635 domain-containing protein [Erwiniaceae]|uniref:DUF2635 domain-containing protein n=1 Tax=Enterobacter agglomerans TaxID=549 RepID=A0ACC5RGU7_ENTAG|nr:MULTISPECIES: DUF2635 domain-containing protein [Erwiniaceae]MBK4723906.1 DUF2635 domain-containing protein [Pantoea agglomerans]MCS3605324.1 hypothetical protein [Erwinia rhapontici]NKG32118.1 DUF2635 domain-containing protein [Erwinia rhapontici]
MQIKPVEGRSVPDPARGDLLPKEGRNVDKNSYWLRRLAAGDVTEVSASSAEKAVVAANKKGGE